MGLCANQEHMKTESVIGTFPFSACSRLMQASFFILHGHLLSGVELTPERLMSARVWPAVGRKNT